MTEEQLQLWKQKKNRCEKCGNIMPIGYAFCDKCGSKMPEISVPIGKDDFKKIKVFEGCLFICFALLLCVIVIFPVAISSVHEDSVFMGSEDFTVENSLKTATIILSVILIIVNVVLFVIIKFLSKQYWFIVRTNPLCIIEQRDMAILLENKMINSQISRKEYEKQRKALSQKMYDTLLKFYL